MKKILIVEDNAEYVRIWTMAVQRKYPNCTILSFSTPQEALIGIAANLDFDILLLDGDLANWTHGGEVLDSLNEEQVKKTAICSANSDFIAEAKIKGVTFQLEKEPDWVEASELFTYIVETLEQIHSANSRKPCVNIKMKEINELTNVDIHHIALKSSICLNSRLVYIVPRISNDWTGGEVRLLEKYLNYSSFEAFDYINIRWWELPGGKELDNITTCLTIKDVVLRFMKKDEEGRFVMKTIDEIGTAPYKGAGSRSGKRQLKNDLNQLQQRLTTWQILAH